MSLTPYDDPTAYSERAIIKPLRERPEWTQVIARGSAQKALTQIPGVKQHHGAWVVEPNAVVAAIGRLGRADGVEVVLRGGVEVDPAPPDGSSVCPEGLWVPPAESGLLRDYQVEDVRFFMEIGGGLAALDMGLGKCQTADTIGFFNGENLEAAVVWERYAGSAEAWRFDGEGYWATPTRPLRAVSLNERSGRIETTLVRRLYRQWVTTRVRRVALDDGSRFGVTIPHRLYVGAGGWTNEYRVGDRVCVPARLPEIDRMCSEEVHYARVVAVDEVDYDGWVYDFDVPEHHNYVAGGALMHNTVEGITFCRQHPGPYIIICPAIAKPVWQREVEKWSPDTPVLVAEGLDPTKSTAHWTWPRDGEQVFIVINYELLDYRFSHGERGKRAKLRDAGKHEEADQIVPHPPLWLERFYDAVFRGERVVGRQPAYTAGAIVLDEAHAVKKGRQVRAMGVEALTRAMPGAKRLALTGTPVYNRIVDLHAVLDWLRPGMFGSWYDFACWYASGYRNSFGFRAVDVARGPELRHRMQWVCRRRTRDEVLHTLPPISREVRSVEDEPTAGKMRRLAAKGVRGLKAALRLGSRKKMKAAFELMEGLSERAVVFGYRVNTVREAFNMACGAKVELVEEDEAAVAEGEWLGATGDDDAEGVRESEVMGRARPVRECIAEGQAEGVRESEVIGRALKEEECEDLRRSSTERGSRPRARGSKATVKVAGTSGYFGDGTACFQIDGRIANSKRQRVISEFTQAEVPAVLFATIDCLKEAVSLTAASFVVFMDIDYLPMKMLQAEARFHRYGQNRRVHVIYLCVKDSPDERTAQFVVEKLAHSGEVLGLSKGEADLKAKVGGMLEDKDKSVLAELFARLTAGGGLDVGALDDWADDDAEVLL